MFKSAFYFCLCKMQINVIPKILCEKKVIQIIAHVRNFAYLCIVIKKHNV